MQMPIALPRTAARLSPPATSPTNRWVRSPRYASSDVTNRRKLRQNVVPRHLANRVARFSTVSFTVAAAQLSFAQAFDDGARTYACFGKLTCRHLGCDNDSAPEP